MAKPTIQEIRDSLKANPITKTVAFRPITEHGFVELPENMLLQALDEIIKKAAFVSAKLAQFTTTERVLYTLFLNHASNPLTVNSVKHFERMENEKRG